jgi:subtilisin family serine protease
MSSLLAPRLCAAPQIAESPAQYRPDQILVQPKPGLMSETLAAFHAAQGTTVRQAFPAFGGLQVLALPVGASVPALIDQYTRSGLFQFAEPDYTRHTALAPNDPKYLDGTLWALNNYGQNGGTPHADISATNAWDLLTSASNIIVAVLDTGVRYSHEDLTNNMWTDINGHHGTNAIAGTRDPLDDEGHGSLLSGVLGATGNNGKGVVGVAWQVQIMACKCFDSAGNGNDSAILACIDYARVNGARILNASFDSPAFGLALSNAIYAVSTAGIVFVASCGNEFTNIDVSPRYPACYNIDNVLSVAYTTRNDALGQYSNYGATNVHLAAPGAAIYSTFFTSDNAYLGGSFLEGTSFAAAYVSGALALVMAKYTSDTYQQIISRLLRATDPVPALAGKCRTGGRLNLRSALSLPIRLSPLTAGADGSFRGRVSTEANRTCVVETGLDFTSWSPIVTNITSVDGMFDFSDLTSTNFPFRFYRAVAQP